MLDAYTVRKAVPRILLAVIGINLSIYVCVAALDITTILGRGIGDILNTAFIPDGQVDVDGEVLDVGKGSNAATGGVLAIIVAKLFLLPGSPGLAAIISSLVPLLLIVGLVALAVFFTLVIRQGLLIFLTVLSPVAMACFVLPGTEKYFQKWLDLFVKTLMTYPIIAIIFAMSNVMAAIILGDYGTTASVLNPAMIIESPLFAQATGQDSSTIKLLKLFTAIVVIYAPLALIPFAFKLAGGAMAAVFNAAQGVSSGQRAKYQKSRAGKMEQARADRASKFERGGFTNRTPIGRLQNQIGRRAAAGARNRYGFGEQGRAAMGLATGANVNETLKNNAALYELRNNDDANNVLALSGGTEAGMREAARDLFGNPDSDRARAAMAAARAAGVTRENAAAALTTSAQNKWRAVAAGRTDVIQEGIGRLAGGNASEAAGLSYSNQYFSRESGRADLGGNYLDQNDQAVQNYAARHGVSLADAQNELATIDGMGRTEVPKMLQGHTSQITHQAQVATRLLNSSDHQERVLGATRLLEMQKNKNYASGENQRILNESLENAGVDFSDQTRGIDAQLADLVSGTHAGGVGPATQAQTISAQELSRLARVYDQDTPLGARGAPGGGGGGGGQTGPQPGPPPAGPQQTNPSDRHLKHDINYLYTTQNGIKVYRFRYIWSEQIYVGVIAQDLIKLHPEALSKDKYGYYQVDYKKLGLEMRSYKDWLLKKT